MEENSEMGQYLVSISKRIAALEVVSSEMQEELSNKSEKIHKKGNSFKEELTDIKLNISAINREISELTASMNSLINIFKRIARKEHMERLQRKIDDWAPEKLATKKNLRRALDSFFLVDAHCVKCKVKQKMHNPEKEILKNGRKALRSTCPDCGLTLFRIVSDDTF